MHLARSSLSPIAATRPIPCIWICWSSRRSTPPKRFGLVQIEAMLNGVPCVASALPGVRMPIQMHGMGRVAAIGDSDDLAECMLMCWQILQSSEATSKPSANPTIPMRLRSNTRPYSRAS